MTGLSRQCRASSWRSANPPTAALRSGFEDQARLLRGWSLLQATLEQLEGDTDAAVLDGGHLAVRRRRR
jgi:hypothetical protein